jgi:predicted secreted hydrolase
MECIKQLLKKLSKIEKELEKVRGVSPLSDGWQTQRLAKKQRKWDELGQEKMKVLIQLNELGYDNNII